VAWGRIELEGEDAAAIAPSFSHDGTKLVYTSATHEQDGRIGANNQVVDVHVVPFNDGSGGPVTALTGAAEPNVAEYYPAFSANDRLVAFNRVSPLDEKDMYYRREGEIFVVPSNGGVPLRLTANDPPACSGEKSPGVTNSWAKWSPTVPSRGGSRYYFLIFSSARRYEGSFSISEGAPSSQLYMAALVEDQATLAVRSYGAVYLWNQDPTTSNLTPAWDTFKIPKVPEPVK
jgi:Tol biopolymer transport system component